MKKLLYTKIKMPVRVLLAFLLIMFISFGSFAQRGWTNDFGNVYKRKFNITANYPLVNSIDNHFSVYIGLENILLLTITKQKTGAVFPRFGYSMGKIKGDTGSVDYSAYSIGVTLNKYFKNRRNRNMIMWGFGLGYELKCLGDASIFEIEAGKTGFPRENKSPTVYFQTSLLYVMPLSRNVEFRIGFEINGDFNNYTYPINQYISGYQRFETQIDLVAGFSFFLDN